MTVAELIEQLKQMPQDADITVWTELGETSNLAVEQEGNEVSIGGY